MKRGPEPAGGGGPEPQPPEFWLVMDTGSGPSPMRVATSRGRIASVQESLLAPGTPRAPRFTWGSCQPLRGILSAVQRGVKIGT